LITKGKVLGVLELYHRVPPLPYPGWVDFLETLTAQAAIDSANTTLFKNSLALFYRLVTCPSYGMLFS
jgi:GAF domain-containing protein